jgi:hypothetical protein
MDASIEVMPNPLGERPHSRAVSVSADLLRASYRSEAFPSEWSELQRRESLERYLKWLGLKVLYPARRLAPTRDIDLFWHLHMLHPVAYHRDCLLNFGRLLDHDGGFGKGPGEAAALREVFLATGTLYEATYGEPYCENGRSVGEVEATNCWHDCQDRCWHACSDLEQ